MVDQFISVETCRTCGLPLSNDEFSGGLCARCASLSTTSDPANTTAASSVPFALAPTAPDAPLDPDHPRWGPFAGIGVWLSSVLAIIVIPVLAVFIWYFIQSARGKPLPSIVARDEMLEWLKSPTLLLVQVLSTIVAHLLTIAVCWAVVTRFGKRPFWSSLGWGWAGRSVWYWLAFSAVVIVAILITSVQVLSRVLPQSDTNSFSELLKSSQSVRVAITVLATFTAPLVEETVYRGILFSSLRRYLGLVPTVLTVTVMFTGVHVLQYFGAWVSVAGLTLLSFTLTVVRARTKSILPCVLIHTLNNGFVSMLILLNKAS
jgi:membrane protease YdiL (CAAX protease family)